MQIVINISEESYKNIKEQVNKRDYPDMQIGRAIVDGVLIPEYHGSLLAYLTTNPEEAEAHLINENIAKGFEEFTKMMFEQGQAEREKE